MMNATALPFPTRGATPLEIALQAVKTMPPLCEYQASGEPAPAGDAGPRVLTLAELLKREFPAREAILEPWLLTQSLTMIHAWRGVGKTHMALGIAYAAATAGAFLTWRALKAWRVLYLDSEMPAAAIRDRLRAMFEADERDFDTSNLLIVTPDVQDGPMPDLATRAGQETIRALAIRYQIDLIIVDNISTLCRDTGPENEAETWRNRPSKDRR